MSATREPAVVALKLCFGFDDHRVLDDVSLRVQPGEIFGVVGADGAGKSTLLRLLIGQLTPTAGEIRVLGLAPSDSRLREQIAYMPQRFGQYPDLSVRENLAFYAALHGLTQSGSAELIADLIARAGLRGFEDRRAGQLSGGMMQKLALACALVSHPRAMFLDEPTTGVDPLSRRAFWQLLEGVRAEGVAIVYATANMQEAERCDRVITLQQGHVAHVGDAVALIAEVSSQLYLVTGPKARALVQPLRQQPGVELAFPVGRQLRVWLREDTSPEAVQAKLPADTGALQWTRVEPGLHDVALRELALTQQEPRHA